MPRFTNTEVIEYWEKEIGNQKTRKTEYIHPRNYLIAVLYYEFKYIEDELAEIFDIHRTTVNHAKDSVYVLYEQKDIKFLNNTKGVRTKFPFIIPESNRENGPEFLYNIIIPINKETKMKLKKYSEIRKRRINQAGAELLKKALLIFEDLYE
jgi:hypothetical protein